MHASGRFWGELGRKSLGALLGVVLSSAASTANAGLGGPLAEPANAVRTTNHVTHQASIQASNQSISQSIRPLAGATLHTQQLASGITLRQYVNPAGLMFAVGWAGPVLPDFRYLLGDYFLRYSQAQRQQSRQIHIQSPDLMLEAGGMMRAFSGHAYLPALLPPTLSAADIH